MKGWVTQSVAEAFAMTLFRPTDRRLHLVDQSRKRMAKTSPADRAHQDAMLRHIDHLQILTLEDPRMARAIFKAAESAAERALLRRRRDQRSAQ